MIKSTVVAALVHLLVFVGLASASPVTSHQPAKPGLTYLYTANITGPAPYDVGVGPYGDRAIYPISGGNFVGPRLKGMLNSFSAQSRRC